MKSPRLPFAIVQLAVVTSFSTWLPAQTPPAGHPPDSTAKEAPVVVRSIPKIHTELCATCHGANWEGGRAPSMLDDVWAHGGEDADLARSIREGNLVNAMPPFKAILSPAEIRGLVINIREARAKAVRTPLPPPREIVDQALKTEAYPLKLEVVAAGLETPWGLAFLPNGQLLVTERPGRLRIVEPGRGVVASISGMPKVWLRQDGGLFDVAVHPDYARNGWIYLSYSESGGTTPGSSSTRVIRGRIKDGALVDQETLFQAPPEQYWVSNTHYGSRFLFDREGFLYFSIGDRGRRDESQILASPYGKFHRIHDDGRIPASNPFVKQADAVKSIFSYGHRNQQGMAQHPVTGELWTTEHGPRGGDELNVTVMGRNYGWPVITYGINDDGTTITDLTEKEGMEQPAFSWTPSIAVSAIEFYTGTKFPKWKNHLFVAGLKSAQLLRLELDGHKVVRSEAIFSDLGRVRDIAIGPDGFIYVSLNRVFNDSPGHIVRLVPAP